MKRTEFFTYKLLTALVATTILFLILISQIINLEVNSRKVEYKKSRKNEELPRFLAEKFDQLPIASVVENNLNQHLNKLQTLETFSFAIETKSKCKFIQSCGISCSGGTLEDTVQQINSLNEKSSCSSEYISLTLENTIFTNNTINSGWLQDVTININSLKMISLDLEHQGESLFSGHPFGTHSNPLSLILSNTVIREYKKSIFTDSSISSFDIHFEKMSEAISIEEELFGDASSAVQEIVLNYCLIGGEALKNLTSRGRKLIGLQSLDLSYNSIFKLENGMFSNAPYLRQLYLRSSGITEIEANAFQDLTQIIQLFLDNNNLKKLPENTFDDMKSLTSLYVFENPWQCECDLQWFQDYLNSISCVSGVQCRIGSNWVDINDVDFCSENKTTTAIASTPSSTESTITTTTTSTARTTENTSSTIKPITDDFVFEKIWCRNLLEYPFDTVIDGEKVVLYESTFKRRKINYTFSEIEDSSLFTLDWLADVKPEDFLRWTNVKNSSDYGCAFNIKSNILMELQYDETYTLCLYSNDTTDTYALIAVDCTAIATPPDWVNRAWLFNSKKYVIILSTVLTFAATIIGASTAVYYVVKCNPELIKGNKRILIVKRGNTSPNILVMPNYKERQISVCTDNEGYLTPKKHWIEKSKLSDLRYQELETITDVSSVTDCDDASEKNIYEAPPLPPNHPPKRRDSGRPYFYSNM